MLPIQLGQQPSLARAWFTDEHGELERAFAGGIQFLAKREQRIMPPHTSGASVVFG
jgi:hypothetical protein